MSKSKTYSNMRIIHRYLGFFLAGIMAVYSISGLILIFRETDFLKSEKIITKEIAKDTKASELGKALKIRELKVEKSENGIMFFKEGNFNTQTGIAIYSKKDIPEALQKLTKLHKSSTKDPLFYLNVFFGLSLLFFVISSFWMFLPSTKIFKKGLYFAIAGIILTLILIFI